MATPGNTIHSKPVQEIQLHTLNSAKTIILAIGNNGRRDDGLGWSIMEAIEQEGNFKGHVEYRYQLQVEDAALIAEYTNVIFIDAFHGKLKNGFSFEKTEVASEFAFSTHIIPPSSILFLTKELYESSPNAFTLAIEGEEWELKKGLSDLATGNLDLALEFFNKEILQK